MPKRKFDVRLRKVGNSYVATIPKDTIDRFGIEEGDYIALALDTEEIKKKERKKR
jgi:putative addiction module antidote